MKIPKLGSIQPFYDKILHVVCTFFAIVWMVKLGCPKTSIFIIVFVLQLIKTFIDRFENCRYKPYGDWIANGIGWFVSLLYLH